MFYTCKIYLNAFILIHPTGIIYVLDVFFCKTEENITALFIVDEKLKKRRSEGIKNLFREPWRVQRRTLEGSATNLGGFAKGPWRVKKYYFYRLPKNVLRIG